MSVTRGLQTAATLAVLFTAATAWAQTATQETARIGIVEGDALPIGLEDAVRMALEQNNDIAVARLQQDIARQELRAALGVYDPRLQPTFLYQQQTLANTSVVGGAVNGSVKNTTWTGGLQFAGLSPWLGGSFDVDFTSTRLETSNSLQRLNPQFPTLSGVSYVQPLLRGLGIDAERREILVSRTTVTLTNAQLSRVLMDRIGDVEQAYWDLYFARRNSEVQATALAQARRQVESNERQAQEGTLAPIDVVEAQIQVATFEQTVANSQQQLTEAENRLKSLIAADRKAPIWNRPLVPADTMEAELPQLSVADAVTLALAQRPELAELEVSVQQNDIDRRFFHDQAKPQLNLLGNYSLAGLAGTVVQPTGTVGGGTPTANPIPPFFVGGLIDSLGNVVNRRFPTASVQMQLDLPLRNRTALANIARNELAGQQLGRTRQLLEQTVESEVRNGLQAAQSSQRRLQAAASAVRNAQQQYDSEQRRFESGLGTVFLVLQRQTALVITQVQEVRARADLNQAIAILNRALGRTLEQHRVRVEGPPPV